MASWHWSVFVRLAFWTKWILASINSILFVKEDDASWANLIPASTMSLSLPQQPKIQSKARKKTKKAKKRGRMPCKTHVINKADYPMRAGLSRPDLHGMDSYEIKVLDFLEHGTASLLGISGVRGVGKTTLLKLVRTYYRQRSSFRYVFFAEAASGLTVDILLHFLSRNIGLGEIAAVNRISNFFKDESFLLLLDNVQASFDLAAAGVPLPLGPRQKVVFTTRNESVCSDMGCAGNIIHMRCLGEEDAWNLFKYNVGDQIIDSSRKIKDLAKEMVIECHGLPRALSAVGRSMSVMEDVDEWLYVHDILVNSSPSNEIQEIDNEDFPFLHFF